MTMSRYYRVSDGAEVPEDEALFNRALRSGYRMHSGMRVSDAKPAGLFLHDTATAFTDHLSSADASRVASILTDFNSREVFRVQRAADDAKSLAYLLRGAAEGGAYGITADARTASATAAEYLHGLHDRALAKVGQLYGAYAGGDRTVDVGVAELGAAAARAVHISQLGDAWRNSDKAAPLRVVADATAEDADAARAKRNTDMTKAWEN
jgi:hypothetical protein